MKIRFKEIQKIINRFFLLIFIISSIIKCGSVMDMLDPKIEDKNSGTTINYNLRDVGPAGGLIFYINPNAAVDGWKYLEAWTADETGTYKWKMTADSTPGTSSAFGTGYENTYSAMTGTVHPGAEVVRNANHGGKSDWFLPSKFELNEMCWVLHSRKWNGSVGEDNPAYGTNRVGSFTDEIYWSSSESNSNTAFLQNFSNGYQNYYSKDYGYKVRAVRRF